MSLAIFIAAGCLTSAAVASAVTYYAVNWSRDRQAENDNARRELAIEHGLRLAQENQQLEQKVSGEQPAVAKSVEVEPFMADSGYQPPRRFDDAELLGPDQLAEMRTYSLDEVIDELGFTQAEIDAADEESDRPCNNCGKPAVFAWKRDGFPFAACNRCVSLWFEDGVPEWVERLDVARLEGVAALAEVVIPGAVIEVAQPKEMWCAKSVEAWCAVLPDEEPEEGSDWVETVCTYGITLPGGYERREPTCPDCRAMLAAHPLRAVVVPVPECPWAECPHPDRCDTGCRWGEEANQWAEVIHADDDGAESLPRVLPEGRID